MWTEVPDSYRAGPRQPRATVLLEAMRPDLAATVAAIPAVPPAFTREEVAQHLITGLLTAALEGPAVPARWTPDSGSGGPELLEAGRVWAPRQGLGLPGLIDAGLGAATAGGARSHQVAAVVSIATPLCVTEGWLSSLATTDRERRPSQRLIRSVSRACRGPNRTPRAGGLDR